MATIINGSNGNDIITVGNQTTTINTKNGNDVIIAGNGANTITTGNGNDSVTVGNGNNDIDTGAGNDIIVAGNGNNDIDAGSGNDRITVGNGNNDIEGGAGNDIIIAGNGNNIIDTGSGNDQVTVGNGNNFISLGSGNDTVTTGNGNNLILGNSGNNTFNLGNGSNIVLAGSGNNTFTFGSGDNLLVANNGYNIFNYNIMTSAHAHNTILAAMHGEYEHHTIEIERYDYNGRAPLFHSTLNIQYSESQLPLLQQAIYQWNQTPAYQIFDFGLVVDAHSAQFLNMNMDLKVEGIGKIILQEVNFKPTDLLFASGGSLAENANNSVNGITVATLQAIDPDNNVQSIASETAGFVVTGTTLKYIGIGFNYETMSSTQVMIKVTDTWGETLEKAMTVTIQDVNEAPTGMALNNASVNENAAGAIIGQVSSVGDPDTLSVESYTYQVYQSDGVTLDSRFTVDSSGNLKLAAGTSLNFEATPTISVLVKGVDHNSNDPTHDMAFQQAFTITVKDLNEAPTGMALSNVSVNEASAGATIGQLSAVGDPDTLSVESYTYQVYKPDGVTLDSRFTVDSSGNLKLAAGTALNFVATPTISVLVKGVDHNSNDPTHDIAFQQAFTITVIPTIPTAVNDSFNLLSNNFSNVLTVSADQGVLANDISHSGLGLYVTADNTTTPLSGGSEIIATEHGSVLLNGDGSFVYTETSAFNGVDHFTYSVSDGLKVSQATVAIAVQDMVTPIVLNPPFLVPEKTTGETFSLAMAPTPLAEPYTYLIDNPNFSIDPNSGVITLVQPLDFFGSQPFQIVNVTATDTLSGISSNGFLLFQIQDTAMPILTPLSSPTSPGVGSQWVFDVNDTDGLNSSGYFNEPQTYSVSDPTHFSVQFDPTLKQLTVTETAAFGYWQGGGGTFNVTATDLISGNSTQQSFTVNVTDTATPMFVSSSNIALNQPGPSNQMPVSTDIIVFQQNPADAPEPIQLTLNDPSGQFVLNTLANGVAELQMVNPVSYWTLEQQYVLNYITSHPGMPIPVPPDSFSVGTVTVTATDTVSHNSVSQDITAYVFENETPVIQGLQPITLSYTQYFDPTATVNPDYPNSSIAVLDGHIHGLWLPENGGRAPTNITVSHEAVYNAFTMNGGYLQQLAPLNYWNIANADLVANPSFTLTKYLYADTLTLSAQDMISLNTSTKNVDVYVVNADKPTLGAASGPADIFAAPVGTQWTIALSDPGGFNSTTGMPNDPETYSISDPTHFSIAFDSAHQQLVVTKTSAFSTPEDVTITVTDQLSGNSTSSDPHVAPTAITLGGQDISAASFALSVPGITTVNKTFGSFGAAPNNDPFGEKFTYSLNDPTGHFGIDENGSLYLKQTFTPTTVYNPINLTVTATDKNDSSLSLTKTFTTKILTAPTSLTLPNHTNVVIGTVGTNGSGTTISGNNTLDADSLIGALNPDYNTLSLSANLDLVASISKSTDPAHATLPVGVSYDDTTHTFTFTPDTNNPNNVVKTGHSVDLYVDAKDVQENVLGTDIKITVDIQDPTSAHNVLLNLSPATLTTPISLSPATTVSLTNASLVSLEGSILINDANLSSQSYSFIQTDGNVSHSLQLEHVNQFVGTESLGANGHHLLTLDLSNQLFYRSHDVNHLTGAELNNLYGLPLQLIATTANSYAILGPGFGLAYDPTHTILSDLNISGLSLSNGTLLPYSTFNGTFSGTALGHHNGYTDIADALTLTSSDSAHHQELVSWDMVLDKASNHVTQADIYGAAQDLLTNQSTQLAAKGITDVQGAVNYLSNKAVPLYTIGMIVDETTNTLEGISLTSYKNYSIDNLTDNPYFLASLGSSTYIEFGTTNTGNMLDTAAPSYQSPSVDTSGNTKTSYGYNGLGSWIQTLFTDHTISSFPNSFGFPVDYMQSDYNIIGGGNVAAKPYVPAVITNPTVSNGYLTSPAASLLDLHNPYGGQDMLLAAQIAFTIAVGAVAIVLTAGAATAGVAAAVAAEEAAAAASAAVGAAVGSTEATLAATTALAADIAATATAGLTVGSVITASTAVATTAVVAVANTVPSLIMTSS